MPAMQSPPSSSRRLRAKRSCRFGFFFLGAGGVMAERIEQEKDLDQSLAHEAGHVAAVTAPKGYKQASESLFEVC
ncbi:hypothetical protein FB451DRAFT_1220472 [Mycena latifolia]|nr:hypothetical protein FB451DRAFT_1220472 [Mycena latifolia]